MVIYWFMFLVPALISLSPFRIDKASRRAVQALVFLTLTVIVGLREHIGHDWNNYLIILWKVETWTLLEAIISTEPGYSVVNWISIQLGWGIYGVNTICAAITMFGLLAFCQRQPFFWRSLALSIPVLVIVVSMAATRQAASVGFLMLAFLAFQDKKLIRYLVMVALAMLFHRAAAIFIPLAIFMPARTRIWPVVLGALAFLGLSALFLREAAPYYQETYLDGDMVANGALPRVAVNLVAAGGFLFLRRQWAARYDDAPMYTIMSLACLFMSVAVLVAPVAADRLLMYMLPIQVAILSRLPEFFSRRTAFAVRSAILSGYAAMMGVWLFYSPFAQISWVPYENILFVK